VNVSGPIKLLELAESCRQFLGMCHVSTCYAVADREGIIEEKLHETGMPLSWDIIYEQITKMDKRDVESYQKNLLGPFPNTYIFTKRMCEHLLHSRNTKGVPLSIVRPSIIGASLEEPFPGWTDSITLVGGIYLIGGLGVLRELPGDQNNIGD
jgi:fatty acyl-CoA reductase